MYRMIIQKILLILFFSLTYMPSKCTVSTSVCEPVPFFHRHPLKRSGSRLLGDVFRGFYGLQIPQNRFNGSAPDIVLSAPSKKARLHNHKSDIK